MLLHAAKRTPRKFIVTDVCAVNAPTSHLSQPRLVRDALAADVVVAVAPEGDASPLQSRTVTHRLKCFRHAESKPIYAKLDDGAPRLEHNGEMHDALTFAGAIASLPRHGYDLTASLHHFANLTCKSLRPRRGSCSPPWSEPR